eukprot:7247376-Prymnesium_polylepis.1
MSTRHPPRLRKAHTERCPGPARCGRAGRGGPERNNYNRYSAPVGVARPARRPPRAGAGGAHTGVACERTPASNQG